MGANQSTLAPPPEINPNLVPIVPKRDKYWASEPDAEKEVFYAKEGIASEEGFKAITVPQLIQRAADKAPHKPALCVERPLLPLEDLPKDPKGRPIIPAALPLQDWKTWTYKDYLDDSRRFAKGCIAVGLQPHEAVNIFGFNSPEWVLAQAGAIFAGGRAAGIYPTDTAEQIQFKCDHANGAVIAVDTLKNLEKIIHIAGDLELLKAIVVWGEMEAKQEAVLNKRKEPVVVLHWEAFMRFGEEKGVTDEDLDRRIAAVKPGHCACLIYTSGTTSFPKAVMLSNDNMIFESYVVLKTGIDNFADKDEQERVVSYLPLSHVAGNMVDIITTLNVTAFSPAHCTVYFARPYDMKAGSLVERLKGVEPTLFLGVPRVWEKMAEKLQAVLGQQASGVKAKLAAWAMNEGRKHTEEHNFGGSGRESYSYAVADKLVLSKVRAQLGLHRSKYNFTGAAPIQLETQRYMGSFGININEVYGMSEGTGGSSWSRDNCHLWGVAGYPMPGTEMRIYQGDPTDINDKKEAPRVDDIFHPTEECQGEVCSRGRNIMMGYLANPRLGAKHVEEINKKNAEAIDNDGFLHSADKGSISKSGFLRITGRYKELIIGAGGENIAPVPIEDNIKKICPIVSNVVMIGDKRKFNIALVTLKLEGATGEFPGTNNISRDAFKASNLGDVTTVEEAVEDKRVAKEITDKITQTNKDGKVVISNACTIQKFMILPRDFSIDTGELTATLKLKRPVVDDKFKDLIEQVYNSKETYVKFPMNDFKKYYPEL